MIMMVKCDVTVIAQLYLSKLRFYQLATELVILD